MIGWDIFDIKPVKLASNVKECGTSLTVTLDSQGLDSKEAQDES